MYLNVTQTSTSKKSKDIPAIEIKFPKYEQASGGKLFKEHIPWHKFEAFVCLGEDHADSCSQKSVEIEMVDIPKYAMMVGIPLAAIFLVIIIICLYKRNQKANKKIRKVENSMKEMRTLLPGLNLQSLPCLFMCLFRC